VSWTHRVIRIGLLMLGAAALLNWKVHHAEVSTADGLRCVLQAQQIERGDFAGGLIGAIDHPLHPLAVAAVHKVLSGGDWPYAWQTAAQVTTVLTLVLALFPIYLLGRELFDETTAWLACLFVFANPVIGSVAVNVLSESTFLLFWTWGLWGAVRFLREGRFVWLPPTIGCGALAYLTRPEGLLLHLALIGTLLLLPVHRLTRIYWPRWWAAIAFLMLGPALLVGPYVIAKGGIGTKPAVARLIGAAPVAPSTALEREGLPSPNESVVQTYLGASFGVLRAFQGVLPLPVAALSILGLAVYRPVQERARVGLFVATIVVCSTAGLIRLHATAGYCSERHALIPGLLLILAAAHGVAWLMRSVSIDAGKLGLGEGRVRPGPAVWGTVLSAILILPIYWGMTPYNSSFGAYRQAGSWLAERPDVDGRVLDLTNWSLFFSQRRGFSFSGLLDAPHHPETRYVVVRDTLRNGRSYASAVVKDLLDSREPVAQFPASPSPGQSQVFIFDLTASRTVDMARRGIKTLESDGSGKRIR
jgi:Dolichyl-phosphate-mannose-protein mannosyltransferase